MPSFPLTPALSLGERENLRQRVRKPSVSGMRERQSARPPLPKGEGWGEGEGRDRPAIPREDELCPPPDNLPNLSGTSRIPARAPRWAVNTTRSPRVEYYERNAFNRNHRKHMRSYENADITWLAFRDGLGSGECRLWLCPGRSYHFDKSGFIRPSHNRHFSSEHQRGSSVFFSSACCARQTERPVAAPAHLSLPLGT